MTCKCPLCESYLDSLDTRVKCYPDTGLLLWHGGYANLTHNQATLLEKLISIWPNSMNGEALTMYYYTQLRHRDDPPSDENVKVMISNLRKTLRKQNAPIEIPPVRTYGTGYRIKFIDRKKEAA